MSQTRQELREQIRRGFGHPMVKVELTDDQINDAISRSRSMFIKWGIGNATKETYFTMLLLEGQRIYDLPAGVTEVIDYIEKGQHAGWPGVGGGGINTLFTFDNYMYNTGQYSAYLNNFDHVSYYIAKDFMNTIDQFKSEKYTYRYHKHTNQLELFPVPSCGDVKVSEFTTRAPSGDEYLDRLFRYPGSAVCELEEKKYAVNGVCWVLLRTYMIEGSTLPVYVPKKETKKSLFEVDQNYAEYLYEEPWIIEYTTALCKITLGYIRRKFGNFASMGNTGISLDGDSLISEGTQEKQELEERLKLEEAHEGYGISIG